MCGERGVRKLLYEDTVVCDLLRGLSQMCFFVIRLSWYGSVVAGLRLAGAAQSD